MKTLELFRQHLTVCRNMEYNSGLRQTLRFKIKKRRGLCKLRMFIKANGTRSREVSIILHTGNRDSCQYLKKCFVMIIKEVEDGK